MARRFVASVALAGLIALGAPAVARAVDDGGRIDRTVQQVQWGTAAGCRTPLREVPDPSAPEACAAIDGRPVSEARVQAYENSWTHRALSLQRGLDEAAPLLEEQLPHTHNSFNASSYRLGSTSYYPTLTNQDPNQVYSLTDQLRMDVRAIEIDVHWVPSPYGNASTGGKWVTMCHGDSSIVNGVHIGCSWDRPLQDGLAEVATWLHAHPDAFILLYLENQLNDDPQAHDVAAQIVSEQLGDLVYRPPADQPCANMPLGTSRAEMRAGGHQVLLVGNCGPGAWGSWVHERGPQPQAWDESGDPTNYGDDQCNADIVEHLRGTFRRWYEDSTWVTNVTQQSVQTSNEHITAAATARMLQCGVNIIGFDQLTPDDGRLSAFVWSWAQNEPQAGAGDCAYQGTDTRFHAGNCTQPRHFACVDSSNNWHVTNAVGRWDRGAAACAAQFPGTTFGVPPNGYRNQLLSTAKPKAGDEVWLAYSDLSGGWAPAA